ncbi:uncharacterized protein LOC114671063 [Macaca mulatta]
MPSQEMYSEQYQFFFRWGTQGLEGRLAMLGKQCGVLQNNKHSHVRPPGFTLQLCHSPCKPSHQGQLPYQFFGMAQARTFGVTFWRVSQEIQERHLDRHAD